MKLALNVLVVALVFSGALARAEFWPNRPQVLRAAEILAEEVEHFDTSLHEVHAPAHVIQKVHHFEETVTEFVEIVRVGTYQEAYSEMSHIRQDVQLIRDELFAHPQLLHYPRVNTEWRHVRTAYRNLDHQMFQHWAGRVSSADEAKLREDMKELEAAH